MLSFAYHIYLSKHCGACLIFRATMVMSLCLVRTIFLNTNILFIFTAMYSTISPLAGREFITKCKMRILQKKLWDSGIPCEYEMQLVWAVSKCIMACLKLRNVFSKNFVW